MRAAESLVDFLRQKAERSDDSVDWAARRRKWKRDIAALYKRVRGLLSPLAAEKAIRIEESKATLREDYLGSYEVPALHILLPGQKVSFFPKGTLVVGAQGRVDVTGRRSSKILVVNNGEWSIVDSSDRLRLTPFTEESFRALLGEVMI